MEIVGVLISLGLDLVNYLNTKFVSHILCNPLILGKNLGLKWSHYKRVYTGSQFEFYLPWGKS